MKSAAVSKLQKMSEEDRKAYLISAKYPTVGQVQQVVNRDFKTWYVAKIRGVVVGNNGEYLHDTPEKALEYGWDVLRKWKAVPELMPEGVPQT
jgi:hypothetical protein